MGLKDFLKKQFVDVIQWTESDEETLSWRFPMQDLEIQNGGMLIVRDSQLAVFVNEGRVADVFGAGTHKLITQNIPVLTNLMNWDKMFESPFKSDVYFFSTRLKLNQKWGTQTPITIRDKDFGAVRMRAYGIYSYRLTDPRNFYIKVGGTRDVYTVADMEGQLRNTIVGRMTDAFASSGVPFLDMAGNQDELGKKMHELLNPWFQEMGLTLDTFVVENLSLPEELQKRLDERIGMNIIGDMGKYTQFQVAQSMPIAAANEGGGVAGIGAGLGAGMAMAQTMMQSIRPPVPEAPAPSGGAPSAPTGETKFCVECGKPIPKKAKFCSECGGAQ